MKRKISYEVYHDTCIGMAEEIQKIGCTDLVCVMRGGMSASHIISKHLNMKCGIFFPDELYMRKPKKTQPGEVIVFIEDLVAKGRTFSEIKKFMYNYVYSNPKTKWYIAPYLIDENFEQDEEFKCHLACYGMKTSEWIVMPYEETDKMVEGDRGLFRNGDDLYGKDK